MSETPRPIDDSLWIDIAETEPGDVVKRVLEHAVANKVGDIFFCAEENYLSVSARHLGIWRRVGQLEAELGRRCLALIKGQAGMDIAEHRKPQDGRWNYRSEDSGDIVDLRINIIPTLHGQDCTLRLLDRNTNLLSLDALGMPLPDYNQVRKMLASPSGLILVTGPTGAGKTTTLYGFLNSLNDGARKINTIEDPIEYALAGVRQSQVNPRLQLGFADLLRNVLRQSPDVIMIGEVRDAETAATAVRAASSGHLVLATMHAPQAVGAVQAMLNLGVLPQFLAGSLIGVVAQRLVRTLNPDTRRGYDIGMAAFFLEEISHLLPGGIGTMIYGPGPDKPGMPAYSGRTGVFEVLAIDRVMRLAIQQGQPASVLRELAIKAGMIPLRQAALLAVAEAKTSIEEVMRVVPAEYLLSE